MPTALASEKSLSSGHSDPNGAGLKKSPTIQDVARAANVAKATASYALSGKGHLSPATREHVLRAARQLGFEPNVHAQRLSNGHSHDMICLFSLYLDLGVGAQKMQVIQTLLSQSGHQVPIYTCGYNHQDEALQKSLMFGLRRQRPRAVICNTQDLGEGAREELALMQREGTLLACYDYELDLPCDQVIFDRDDNTYQTARFLLQSGHRQIAFLHHMRHLENGPRSRGFERALAEAGLKPEPGQYFSADCLDYEEGGQRMAQWYLGLPHAKRPTGVCILNDFAAHAFITEVRAAGIAVPQQLSVVSHDDLPVARYGATPLTSVSHPATEIARQTARLLESRLVGEYSGPPRKVMVRGELKVRQSSAPYGKG